VDGAEIIVLSDDSFFVVIGDKDLLASGGDDNKSPRSQEAAHQLDEDEKDRNLREEKGLHETISGSRELGDTLAEGDYDLVVEGTESDFEQEQDQNLEKVWRCLQRIIGESQNWKNVVSVSSDAICCRM
tara:strand:- start:325 stop:711 length:387 start_codon:yes stop_codon:yes gene_type:complete